MDKILNKIKCFECDEQLSFEDEISDGDYQYNYLKYQDKVYLLCNSCYEEKMKEED